MTADITKLEGKLASDAALMKEAESDARAVQAANESLTLAAQKLQVGMNRLGLEMLAVPAADAGEGKA